MIEGRSVVAVVVARGGSRRLPRKNLLPFAGRTVVGHKVWQLGQVPGVDLVVVGSDDDEILAEGRRYGALGMVNDGEYATSNDMLADMAARVSGDVVLWAHPTNPLVSPATYARALAQFFASKDVFDSLVSVYRMQRHAWMGGLPLNYNPRAKVHPLARDCAPIFFQDGAIFIQPREQMARNRYFFGESPLLFEMPEAEVVDIDTRADYELLLRMVAPGALAGVALALQGVN